MAVTEGRDAKITVVNTTKGAQTLAEMGEWSIGGISRDMIEVTSFGSTTKKYKHGMLDPGEITFSGYWDPTDSDGQLDLVDALSSGISIGNSTTKVLRMLRLWASDSTAAGSTSVYGFWSCTGSSGELLLSSMEVGTDKNGVGTLSLTLKVSDGELAWSTST